MEGSSSTSVAFGRHLKSELFMLADEYVNLNHGSFGTVPKAVFEEQSNFHRLQESRPDEWFRSTYYSLVDSSRQTIADLIKADVKDVVLVENASTAVNSILRSFNLQRGDKVLVLSTVYSMVTETLDWQAVTAGVQVVVVQVKFPLTGPEAIVEAVTAALEAHPDVKISLFSHISSMPTMIEPVKALTAVVKRFGGLCIIDGAHAPGVLDIDVADIGADFYLGNCHKWLYCPKGAAFMWVSPAQQTASFPEPTVISSSCVRDFIGRFAYTGTRDYTAFASIPTALRFIDSSLGGQEAVRQYCFELCRQAASRLCTLWGTSLLVPADMTAFMCNVLLPSDNEQEVKYLQQTLDKQHNFYFVYGKATVSQPQEKVVFFVRISAQVYLDLDIFDQFGQLLLDTLAAYRAGNQL